jgi:hypothetical protein
MKELTKEQIEQAISILQDINVDAQMALSGDWDRSDDGFQSQLELIHDFFAEIEVEPEIYIPGKVRD